MATFDDLVIAEKAQRMKRENAANDEKTLAMLPSIQARFDGRKIAAEQIELKVVPLQQLHGPDVVAVKLHKWTFSLTGPQIPDWLGPKGMEPNYLFLARVLPNGKCELRASTPSDRPAFKCEYDTSDAFSLQWVRS